MLCQINCYIAHHKLFRSHTCSHAYSSKVLRQIQSTIDHGNYLKIQSPGAIKTIMELRVNHRKITILSCRNYINSINTNNLTYAKITHQSGSEVTAVTRIATLNVRSIKYKDHLRVNEINVCNVDLAIVTEAWFKDTNEDQTWLDQPEFKQCNYNTLVQNRQERRRGSDDLQ